MRNDGIAWAEIKKKKKEIPIAHRKQEKLYHASFATKRNSNNILIQTLCGKICSIILERGKK